MPVHDVFGPWALEREGAPFPEGVNLMLVGWVRIYRLAKYVKQQQPQTAAFLGLFFVFSDGRAWHISLATS